MRQAPAWQSELAQAVTDPEELLRLLGLNPAWGGGARAAARTFALRVPRAYVARMRRGDPHDPLLRQVLPLADELEPAAGFTLDPVGDLDTLAAPGLLHKYPGRALVLTTGACAVHCRYCFRRHFPYAAHGGAPRRWRAALARIAADPALSEIILSGGDPLSLGDRQLASLVEALDPIPHLKRLRLHTRLPVVLPARVDSGLLEWLAATRLTRVVVIHANHANEIDADVARALGALRKAGCTLLNQAVLLRGVNDSADAQAALAEALFETGVLPYYLHLLDPVQGAAHFEVPADEARALVAAVRARLPGYLVPRLVREIPGADAKRPLEAEV